WPPSHASAPGPLTPTLGKALTSHSASTGRKAASLITPTCSTTGAPASWPHWAPWLPSSWWTGLRRRAGSDMVLSLHGRSFLPLIPRVVERQRGDLGRDGSAVAASNRDPRPDPGQVGADQRHAERPAQRRAPRQAGDAA